MLELYYCEVICNRKRYRLWNKSSLRRLQCVEWTKGNNWDQGRKPDRQTLQNTPGVWSWQPEISQCVSPWGLPWQRPQAGKVDVLTETYCLTVLDARSLKSKCQLDWFLLRAVREKILQAFCQLLGGSADWHSLTCRFVMVVFELIFTQHSPYVSISKFPLFITTSF